MSELYEVSDHEEWPNQCQDSAGFPYPEHDYDDSDECTRCGALGEGWDE